MIQTNNTPRGWLAFELNVLKRLNFTSAALPFTSDANLGSYLKRWKVRVLANDLTLSGWTKAAAAIQNNSEKLSDDDVNIILEDAYVPRYRLQNQALRNWFGETDAWWFDNIRQNIERLPSPIGKAIASTVALNVGDYVLSFTADTLELRQPLSTVFRRLVSAQHEPVNNGQNNTCTNKNAYEFIAENFSSDLMFLRLPRAHNLSQRNYLGWTAWREEFLRGGDDFWNDLEVRQASRLGTLIETKSQYLRLLEETLRTASHIKTWAIAHVEDGFIATQDIVETIGRIRRVETIYTKDFSELTGTKAVIITA
ncbi:MAG TPA: hypothetical protein VNB22_14030 [Pyrinomonadaceae bacterium]|nr:hypothetical protein [Pyrinomonadaceae bacterium]